MVARFKFSVFAQKYGEETWNSETETEMGKISGLNLEILKS